MVEYGGGPHVGNSRPREMCRIRFRLCEGCYD